MLGAVPSRQRLASSAWCGVVGGVRSLRPAVGASCPLWGRTPLRRSRDAAACSAAPAPLVAHYSVPPRSRRRESRRRSFAAAARALGAMWRGRKRALSARGWRRGRALSGGGRRRAGLTAPLLRRQVGGLVARSVMLPRLRRRDARPPRFRGGGSLYRRARCVVLGSSRSLRVALCAVAVARRSRCRCLRRRAGAPSAGSIVPPCSRRRDARPPHFRGGGSLSRRTRSVVLGSSRSRRLALEAVAVARRSRRRCLRRRAGAPSAGLFMPPCRGCVALDRRSFVAAVCSLGPRRASGSAARAPCEWLWGRSPSCGAHGAAAFGAALALLAPARSCRRARGGIALGRRSSMAAARFLGAHSAPCSAARAPCM